VKKILRGKNSVFSILAFLPISLHNGKLDGLWAPQHQFQRKKILNMFQHEHVSTQVTTFNRYYKLLFQILPFSFHPSLHIINFHSTFFEWEFGRVGEEVEVTNIVPEWRVAPPPPPPPSSAQMSDKPQNYIKHLPKVGQKRPKILYALEHKFCYAEQSSVMNER
jgi:hypothetical protein